MFLYAVILFLSKEGKKWNKKNLSYVIMQLSVILRHFWKESLKKKIQVNWRCTLPTFFSLQATTRFRLLVISCDHVGLITNSPSTSPTLTTPTNRKCSLRYIYSQILLRAISGGNTSEMLCLSRMIQVKQTLLTFIIKTLFKFWRAQSFPSTWHHSTKYI